jgi:hypothetical protein
VYESTTTCNSNRIEDEIIGGDISNDNSWKLEDDTPKFKCFKLLNIVKICVYINIFPSSIEYDSSFALMSIASDEI